MSNMYKSLLISGFAFLILRADAQVLYESIQTFQADRGALTRKYHVHEHPDYYHRMLQLFSDHLEALEKLNFDELQAGDRVDYLTFRNYLNKEHYFTTLAKEEFEQVQQVTDFAGELYDFIELRKNGQKPDAQKWAATFEKASKTTAEHIKNLRDDTRYPSWQQAEKASDVIKSLRENLAEAFQFYFGYDIVFSWWVEKPFKSLHEQLEVYEKAVKEHFSNELVKDDGSGIIGKPIGRNAIIKSLEFEMIPYTPEELIALAERELAWCEAEMLKATEELGFGTDWQAAMEHVKNQFLDPGDWPQRIHEMAEEAIQFVEDRDLMTVPELAKETWRMTMMTPERQLMSPFFLGGEAILIAYPTNTMDHEAKMMSLRGNNPHFARAVVHHELIPGHHMQQFMNQRHKPYRRLFYTPFWIEGWALYWEFNLYEKGFAQSPEDKIGMLFWRKHRAARIIFSLNYHMEKMSPQECIDFLVDKVGHERANAEAEVRRSFTGRYGPLYQVAYMIGGIQFSKLKSELVDNVTMTEKEFHDRIMQENAIPVEMVRAILMDEQLPSDFKTNWRFLD